MTDYRKNVKKIRDEGAFCPKNPERAAWAVETGAMETARDEARRETGGRRSGCGGGRCIMASMARRRHHESSIQSPWAFMQLSKAVEKYLSPRLFTWISADSRHERLLASHFSRVKVIDELERGACPASCVLHPLAAMHLLLKAIVFSEPVRPVPK